MRYPVYYPTPIKGETVFSWVARAHSYSGYPSFRNQSLKALQINTELASTEFPSYIAQLAKSSGVDKQWIVQYMTGINYYRPFQTQAQYQHLQTDLLSGNTASMQSCYGMVANRLLTEPVLKSCPACVAYDEAQHGFAYWHVIHQLTGMTCCPLHGVMLHSEKRIRSFAAQPETSEVVEASANEFNLSTCIALAFIDEPISFEKDDLLRVLKNRLLEMGMVTACGNIRKRLLVPMMIEEIGKLSDCVHFKRLACGLMRGSYPANLFYQPHHQYHPLKYYFLIHCLFGSWERFKIAMEAQPEKEPKTPIEPTQCLTSLIDNSLIIKYLKDGDSMRKIAAQTGKSIAYIKKVAANNQIAVDKRPSKIFSVDERDIWRKLMVGIPTEVIAKEHGISQGAVELILGKFSELVTLRKAIRFNNKRQQCRQEIDSFCQCHPQCRQKEVRANCGASYMWLYKHDKCWLEQNLPSPIPRALRYLGK
ncbi:TnsD family transposase [Pseudoalteromonas shioyasakiensis]|uniref:TnsD family transposase n=1 Tax=Pseudoalteromonas shioyasakiensis TaxID=1190813 RepID=A0ABT6U2B5_9GAMM|nr:MULTISPECIES: TnsD family Tn7-like transposition protein [Pseudoalteromonas]MDI4669395.1 TnsD family transposase [Pseudoalteromonas shioyasakiensis]MDI4673412.1 TnsD family transposase [Pseudoalteromonas shioyasakiensis]MDI4685909.1 TnsD family transposase [Pseudoalteromonas shioyasakiensis]MDI4704199.1 TnsD family transposase [Pseudoalteromonas shioyasakiensis]NUJ23506.1 TniQ family protein [Pseudoalteromonas sp. 0802]